jgi:hypothetical protein
VAIDDYDLLASVAGHLAYGFLQQGELRGEAVGKRAGLLARFEDLPEVVFGEDHGVLLLHRVHHGETHIEKISAEGQMRSMLFHDAERQHANTLRLMDSLHEIGSRELLPFCSKARLRNRAARVKQNKESNDQGAANRFHVSPRRIKTGDFTPREAGRHSRKRAPKDRFNSCRDPV